MIRFRGLVHLDGGEAGDYRGAVLSLMTGEVFRHVAQWESTVLTRRGSAVQVRPCLPPRTWYPCAGIPMPRIR